MKFVLLIIDIISIAMIFKQRKADFRLVSGNEMQRLEVAVTVVNIQFQTIFMLRLPNLTAVEVILVLSVILAGFRPPTGWEAMSGK